MSVISRWSRVVVVAAAILLARPGFGAPALTTIQDVLYKADGTRFNGTLYIAWTSFQAGDATTIPTQEVTVNVVNGAFRAQLVPTTNASAGANYNVRYMSQGKFQFSETWAVPASTTPLRVRDVRVSTGTVVGTPPVITQMLISDVSGLGTELGLRPTKGLGFQPARAAVISSSGQIEAAQGDASDCVHVDGSTGSCGSGGSGGANSGIVPTFVDSETPSGIVDGVNTFFGLANSPSPAQSLKVYRNGLALKQALDYTLSGATITFLLAPQPGDVLMASYRLADPTNPAGSLAATQVICSGEGAATTESTSTPLGSCTIPSALLKPGDRFEISFDFAHSGLQSSIFGQVRWGNSTLAQIGASAAENFAGGRVSVGLHSAGAIWRSEWISSTAASAYYSSGTAPDVLSGGITIFFFGQVATPGVDSAILRNFTVTRYPVQSNQ